MESVESIRIHAKFHKIDLNGARNIFIVTSPDSTVSFFSFEKAKSLLEQFKAEGKENAEIYKSIAISIFSKDEGLDDYNEYYDCDYYNGNCAYRLFGCPVEITTPSDDPKSRKWYYPALWCYFSDVYSEPVFLEGK